MDIKIKNLENIPPEMLLQVFDEGFADYEVDMRFSTDIFKSNLVRIGYNPSLSVAALDGDKLVGFILNGTGDWNGLPTIYDGGTCVIPSYRKKGIASEMIEGAKKIAVQNGLKQWIVECLQTNRAGLGLYETHGFEIRRRFDCLNAPTSEIIKKTEACYSGVVEKGMTFKESSINEIKLYSDFQDTTPSWQNSDEAAVAGNLSIIALKDLYDKMCGYVLFKNGSIARLAIAPLRRGNGYGQALLNYVASRSGCDEIRFVNINEKNDSMLGFLAKLGFKSFARQFELCCML